ncbi:Cthe_2314 family HEPN domain-containing protein [Halobacillus sp. Cin3]|uniref:Cthe_2314 family HEPN domain-containing protein n=1 Tax=Halobacillus sp. Cin3 TaxID=2928441 RepID=UPI00248F0E83|nr:Cthe_2314 family HEPN domain-containing protein [Halobacillus sp. Cin3]
MENICLSCNEKEIKTPKSNFCSSIEYCCDSCSKLLLKKHQDVKNKALKLIQKNNDINSKFDLVYSNEMNHIKVTETDSRQSVGSIQVREYLFSLLEEVHQFSYNALFESYLYAELFENYTPEFFNERFFLHNAVLKSIGAWEKLIRYFAVFYGVELSDKSSKNTLTQLQKQLKRKGFKETKTYNLLWKLKSHNVFNELDKVRKTNDHSLSYHLGTDLYTYSKVSEYVVQANESVYEAITEALEIFSSRCVLSNVHYSQSRKLVVIRPNEKVIKKKYGRLQHAYNENLNKQLYDSTVEYIRTISTRLAGTKKWNKNYSSPNLRWVNYQLSDAVFRLHETSRSLSYMEKMFFEAVDQNYKDLDNYWIYFDGLNYRYFLLSGLIRIYSVYDKISKVIRELFEVDASNNSSFSGVISHIRMHQPELHFLPPIKICERILGSKAFKKLDKNRQDHFHLVTLQNFINSNSKEVIDLEVLVTIQENAKNLFELIESLDVAVTGFYKMFE